MNVWTQPWRRGGGGNWEISTDAHYLCQTARGRVQYSRGVRSGMTQGVDEQGVGERLQRAGIHHLELIQVGVQQKANTTLHVNYTPIKE